MGSTPLAERVTTSIQHSEIGHQVLSHLKRFITETPEADGSLLELLEEKLQTSGYHQSLQNAIYHRLCQEIEKSELGSDEVPFLEEAQLRWQTNLVRSLKSTAKELGLPLCRKRTVGEQNLIEDRWFDLGQEEIELLAIRPMYSPQDLLDYLLSTTTPSDKITDDDAESSRPRSQRSFWIKVRCCQISPEVETLRQEIYDTNDVLAAREFLKRGCPQSMRKVFWLKVLGVSSAERGIVSLAVTFERLLQCKEPQLLPTLQSKNINLLPTVFQMLMHCFCQRLPVKEVLKLWDRILAYDSLYILPGDIVLLSEPLEELQGLLKICGEQGTRLGLVFNTLQSGVLRMDVEPEDGQKPESASTTAMPMITIQGQSIVWKSEYKYLEVTLRPGRRYLKRHETGLRATANPRKGYQECRALWSFSRY
ncbi:hypothetical protein HPB47_017348 [Ixodes persulcatus]|uniref:Uncharacterized protein n=1 Tax=Ixodes persulcatus TaxID=34615 RepID=A0AC60QNI6_IXOPE|nr:hypothetical protein HPB47_017348 [Ixodes persulcatus]